MTARKAPDDLYIAEQPAAMRALLESLRVLIRKSLPDADVSIKWGVPFYTQGGKQVCALACFKEHVGINFFAPPEALSDPAKKLEGGGKSSRMLKVRTATEIDRAAIARWLKVASRA